MSKVTIKDIAQKAGVSVTAVSFAFNNPSRLGGATVQRILEVADELGYTPDPVARSMSTGRTGTLGILVPQPIPEIISNPFLPELIEGIGEACMRSGFSLMIVPPLEGSMKRAVSNVAVDGFVTLGLESHKATMMILQQRGTPFVTVDSDPIEGVPAVNVDDAMGAYDVMRHVLEAGHREITVLAIRSGKHGHYQEYAGTLRQRMDGYLTALQEYGLTLDGKHIQLVETASTVEGGISAFQKLWKTARHPTCIVAMSDVIAMGAMHSARQAGISVPNELSIVGFDDIPFAALMTPPLTTVGQQIRQKGKLAADLLVELIEGKPSESNHHLLPTRLVLRDTVCPPMR
ncbi:MAG: LacI family DNA-binding transcriptional regulator [Anaerolineae bacterium]|nr:LacI family DNA-binding transcriptional regulator [Anaerolineae bacterium]